MMNVKYKTACLAFVTLLLTTVLMGQAIAGDIQYDIRVDGITCPFCVATSEQELKRIDGVHQVAADLKQGMIMVCTDDSVEFTDSQLRQLFLEKGFTYRAFNRAEKCNIAE